MGVDKIKIEPSDVQVERLVEDIKKGSCWSGN